MEIVVVDSAAYQALVKKIDKIAEYILTNEGSTIEKNKEAWLDSYEVAKLLKISTKTLQRLRKDKLISYTILRGKCLYKLSDIEKGLNERIIRSKPETLEELHQQYRLSNGAK